MYPTLWYKCPTLEYNCTTNGSFVVHFANLPCLSSNRQILLFIPSFYLSLCQSSILFLISSPNKYLSIFLSIHPSIRLFVYASISHINLYQKNPTLEPQWGSHFKEPHFLGFLFHRFLFLFYRYQYW